MTDKYLISNALQTAYANKKYMKAIALWTKTNRVRVKKNRKHRWQLEFKETSQNTQEVKNERLLYYICLSVRRCVEGTILPKIRILLKRIRF